MGLGPAVLWVADLDRSKAFYRDSIGLTLGHGDATSVSLHLGDEMVALLVTLESAASMLRGNEVATPNGQPTTCMFCLFVADVDERVAELAGKGVDVFLQPAHQYWGRRTAHFRDPDGWVWELSQPIA
jgi:catechol 2,3-dioxygenase-like lactoylglutathione lyase family enzyme